MRAPRCPRSSSRTAEEFLDLQERLDTSEARTRQREGKPEDVCAAAEAELEDTRTAADARILESELEHEHAALEKERKRTTEPVDRLAFLELEVASSSMRGERNCHTA